jgi:hypothetical protein
LSSRWIKTRHLIESHGRLINLWFQASFSKAYTRFFRIIQRLLFTTIRIDFGIARGRGIKNTFRTYFQVNPVVSRLCIT